MANWIKAALILSAGLFFLSGAASATVITFDSAVVGSPNQVVNGTTTFGGFDFTSSHYHLMNSPPTCSLGGCADNGSIYLGQEAGGLGKPIAMTGVLGSIFSLQAVDATELFLTGSPTYPKATSLYASGTFAGGGTITSSFALDGLVDGAGGVADFQTFAFSALWTNLTSVTFSGSALGTGALGFDNVVVNQPSGSAPIPEPSAALVFGLGSLIVAYSVRRRAVA